MGFPRGGGGFPGGEPPPIVVPHYLHQRIEESGFTLDQFSAECLQCAPPPPSKLEIEMPPAPRREIEMPVPRLGIEVPVPIRHRCGFRTVVVP